MVDRVFLLVEPKYQWNPEERQQREQSIKQMRLATADIFVSGGSRPGYRDYARKLLFDQILNKLVDNVQLHVREVHIRYEDRVTCPTDFCIGFSLESLHMQTREPEVGELPVAGRLLLRGPNTFHKHAMINHLAVYWNPISTGSTDTTTRVFVGNTMVEDLMSRTIAKRHSAERPKHHYFLEPVDISAEIDVSVDPKTMHSRVCVKVEIPDISVNFEDKQFREILSLSTNISNFYQLETHSMHRPMFPVTSSSDSKRAWWRYAINAVRTQVLLY